MCLLCMLEEVEGSLYLLEALRVPEVIRCVLLYMLEDVEGELCSLEVMRCALGTLYAGSCRGRLCFEVSKFRCGSALRNERSCMRPPHSIFA